MSLICQHRAKTYIGKEMIGEELLDPFIGASVHNEANLLARDRSGGEQSHERTKNMRHL